MRDLAKNRAVWHSSAADYDHTGHLTTSGTGLPWISGGKDAEWLLLDLGAVSEIRKVTVRWGNEYARSARIELSEDGEHFSEAAVLSGAPDTVTEAELLGRGRYLKLCLSDCSGLHYIICQLSVFGENDLF